MARIRRVGVLFTAVALVMSLAAPGMAQGPKHKSCEGFGQFWAGFAQTFVPSGQIIAANTHGFEAPWGITYSGPGTIADIVHYEQNHLMIEGEFLCEKP